MIEIPTLCPTCQSKLERVNDQLFCRNKECPAQIFKKIAHFAKTMKIKGMGEKTIEKLQLEDITDIFHLTPELCSYSIGDKLGIKLSSEIEQSKANSLDVVLASFSIPLIGTVAAKKIASLVTHVSDINEELCKKAGLGDKASSNLLNWIETDFKDKYSNLDIFNSNGNPVQANNTSNIGTVCITGKLKQYKSRAEAAKYLESLGYKVIDSVTKTTDYLIDEEGKQSSKRTKAETLGINITTIDNLIKEL